MGFAKRDITYQILHTMTYQVRLLRIQIRREMMIVQFELFRLVMMTTEFLVKRMKVFIY